MFEAIELGKTVKVSSYKSSLFKDRWGAVRLRDVLQSEMWSVAHCEGLSATFLGLGPWYGKVSRRFAHTVTLTWIIWHVHFVLPEHCLEGFDLIAEFGWCLHTVSSPMWPCRRWMKKSKDWIAQCLLMGGSGGGGAGGVYQRTLDKSSFRLKILLGHGFSQLNFSVLVSLSCFTWIFEGCFISWIGCVCSFFKK